MTREEAIKIFNEVLLFGKANCTQEEFKELAKMSIHALEQEPKSEWEKDHEILKAYSDGADDVIDKIRAEIEQTRKMYLEMNDIDWLNGCDYVLSVIDKYKGESEG